MQHYKFHYSFGIMQTLFAESWTDQITMVRIFTKYVSKKCTFFISLVVNCRLKIPVCNCSCRNIKLTTFKSFINTVNDFFLLHSATGGLNVGSALAVNEINAWYQNNRV